MQSIITIAMAAAVLALLAVAVAWVLGWANRAFHVEVDPKVERVLDVLPNANCGACGYIGCSEYAEACAAGTADINLCAPGGAGCAKQLAEILGVELEESYPYRAVVHCAAHWDERLLKAPYAGEPTCAAANLVAGVQGCTYGCLGRGDCVRACDYDAIHTVDGLATVDYDKCIGCKACARVCPRNIITMVPFKREQMLVVACSNQDKGPEVKSVCTVGCIGCSACTRRADPMRMEGNLPVVDYDAYQSEAQFEEAQTKCPRGSMINVGRPSEEDLAAVADEPLPDRIEADFKTTVDDTDWWG
jgi:Na+-translocating ferredoxin:NAD+ oxidoreductase RNF subunit RnfB